MTPEKVTVSVQLTRRRELELSASQVENIVNISDATEKWT